MISWCLLPFAAKHLSHTSNKDIRNRTLSLYMFSDSFLCLGYRAYINLAAELGLWMILRPGPYISSELDLGGLPRSVTELISFSFFQKHWLLHKDSVLCLLLYSTLNHCIVYFSQKTLELNLKVLFFLLNTNRVKRSSGAELPSVGSFVQCVSRTVPQLFWQLHGFSLY